MTVQTPRLRQRYLGVVILSVVVAFDLTACSPSDKETTAADVPAATATSQGSATTAPVAAQARFTAYAASIPAAISNRQCALDTINSKPAAAAAPLAAGSVAVFRGWAGNGKGQAANDILLVLKGTQSYSAPIATGSARPDVAKALSSDGMAKAGYNSAASLEDVAAGSYRLFIVDPLDASNVCDLRRSITVQ